MVSTHRLVLVGENPHRTSIAERPGLALTGSSGRNLCKIAGWEWLDYLRYTERLNLFYDPQPVWSRTLARESASEMLNMFENRRVILLGAKVAEAFGQNDAPLYRWFTERFPNHNTAVAFVPHPSGQNRVWNMKPERDRARAFLEDLIP